jgi:hypothetical protein
VVYNYGICQCHGIYHYDIYHFICELTVLTFRFPCQAERQFLVRPSGSTLPSSSQSWKPSEQSPSRAEWNSEDERNWDDYNYVSPAHSDALANLWMCHALPGLDADAIAAMIRDLPMQNAVEVPRLRVDEAIEV